jgi:hypothetical protein
MPRSLIRAAQSTDQKVSHGRSRHDTHVSPMSLRAATLPWTVWMLYSRSETAFGHLGLDVAARDHPTYQHHNAERRGISRPNISPAQPHDGTAGRRQARRWRLAASGSTRAAPKCSSQVRSSLDCNLGCSSLRYSPVHQGPGVRPELRREHRRTAVDVLRSSFNPVAGLRVVSGTQVRRGRRRAC